MVLIKKKKRSGYVLFSVLVINNAYMLHKHNCKLFYMPPKDLLDFRSDLVNLLFRRNRIESDQYVLQSSSHSRDGIPSCCSLYSRVGEVGILRVKCHHYLDVGRRPVHHTTFAGSFVKFVSARFSVLQTITRTELYVVSC